MEYTKTEAASPVENGFCPIGSPGRTRTSDQLVNSQPLYRLSYRGIVPGIIPYSHDSSRVKYPCGPLRLRDLWYCSTIRDGCENCEKVLRFAARNLTVR